MLTVWRSVSTDTTLQPQQVTNNTATLGLSSLDQQVMHQFTQMRSLLSSFLRQKQEPATHTAFCNYLALQVEGLQVKDFQIFRKESVQILSSNPISPEKCGRQAQQPQQQTLSQSSSATSTFVSQTFQQPEQPSQAAREYNLTTQMPSSQVIKPAQQSHVATKGQQQQSKRFFGR